MVFVFGKDSDVQSLLPPCQDVVRSQAPDVTVLVGSGESKQEFKCYKVILSFASEYLDAMLSSNMKEGEMGTVEFPDKDPEEWKLFYDFISPQKIGEASISAVISDDNVMILLPWFNEFGINAYVKECDVFLSQRYLSDDEKMFWDKVQQSGESVEDHQTRLAARKSKFDALLGVLSLANMYSLPLTKAEMEKRVAELLNTLVQTHDLFDQAAITSISQSLPPLSIDTRKDWQLMKEKASIFGQLVRRFYFLMSLSFLKKSLTIKIVFVYCSTATCALKWKRTNCKEIKKQQLVSSKLLFRMT